MGADVGVQTHNPRWREYIEYILNILKERENSAGLVSLVDYVDVLCE